MKNAVWCNFQWVSSQPVFTGGWAFEPFSPKGTPLFCEDTIKIEGRIMNEDDKSVLYFLSLFITIINYIQSVNQWNLLTMQINRAIPKSLMSRVHS